CQQGKSIPLTF
nr:immunoglobulin light chain junction region [Macaca mulatta]MOY13924.1 immunoglobulin light chain junction region [Macaca mulatta]